MKHRRWISALFAVLIVAAVFLLPGGVTEAQAAGPLTVDFMEDGDCWENWVKCGSVVWDGLEYMDFHFRISSPVHCVLTSVEITLPEGFLYFDGASTNDAKSISTHVNRTNEMVEYGGWGSTHPFFPFYLPDATKGEEYELTIKFRGRAYPDYDNTYTDGYFYEFEQEVSHPFFRVLGTWNSVSVSDEDLGNFTLQWDDSIFTSDYNQKAAELSAVMSKLAYNEEAMLQMFRDLGCTKVESYNTGVNVNGMGLYIGEKWILQDGKWKKIIFAVGRGTYMPNDYDGREWLGNLNVVGSEAVHRGFKIAADQLFYRAKVYYRYEEISTSGPTLACSPDTFVLFTGHSKAAGAANLAAHYANGKGWDYVAYTFATPTVERDIGTTTSGEKGIYNWVYYQDAIRNAPTMKQYGRYGSTRIFGFEIPGDAYINDYGSDLNWTDSYGFTHRTRYGFTMQEYLNAALSDMNVNNKMGTLMFISNRISQVQIKVNELMNTAQGVHSMKYYYEAVKRGAGGADIQAVMDRTEVAAYKLDEIAAEMIPDGKQLVQHQFYCPVNLYVYDQFGNLAGSIEGDRVYAADNELILYGLLDSKVVMYDESLEGQYHIEVTGYADGEVTHSTTYYSMDGTDEMLVSQTIPVSNGQTISFSTDPHGDSSYTTYTDEAEIRDVVYELLGVEPEASMPFTDVPEGKWYYDYVDYVYQNGLMNGTSDTKFDPTGTMTRAMLATVIYRAAGAHALPNEMPFTDVPSGKWYTDAVNWAYINNIVNGTSDTLFSPNSQITREQIVTMFYRYAQNWQCDTSIQADLSGYSDAGKIGNYAKEPFRWAVAAGIINGTTDTTLEPKAFATRAQCAAIMQRFNEYIGQ